MMTTKDIVTGPTTGPDRDGKWWPCLPYPGPLMWRVRDAWEVICGRAEAVKNHTVSSGAGETGR